MISKELTRRVDVVWTIFKMEYSEIYGEQFSKRQRRTVTVTVTASGKIFGIYPSQHAATGRGIFWGSSHMAVLEILRS